MAARVNTGDVRAIFETDLEDAALTVFINSAHIFVDARLSTAGLSADVLKEIERYVAAHFACVADPRAHRERRGDASVDYQNADGAGSGLGSTDFGKLAMQLDPTGALATAGDRPASFEVIDPVLEDAEACA